VFDATLGIHRRCFNLCYSRRSASSIETQMFDRMQNGPVYRHIDCIRRRVLGGGGGRGGGGGVGGGGGGGWGGGGGRGCP
jgi:hypothetical protein